MSRHSPSLLSLLSGKNTFENMNVIEMLFLTVRTYIVRTGELDEDKILEGLQGDHPTLTTNTIARQFLPTIIYMEVASMTRAMTARNKEKMRNSAPLELKY